MEDKQIYTTSKIAELERQAKKIWANFSEFKNKHIKRVKKGIRNRKVQVERREEKKSVSYQNIRIEREIPGEEIYIEKSKIYTREGLKLPPEKIQFIITITLFLLIILVMFIGIYLPYTH